MSGNALSNWLGPARIFCHGDETFRSCVITAIQYRPDGQPVALVIEEIPGRSRLIPWHALLEVQRGS